MHDSADCPVCQIPSGNSNLVLDADNMVQGTVIKATPPKPGWTTLAVEYMIKSGWPKLAKEPK